MQKKVKTALLSIFKKEGIEHFARALIELGWNILASAGTVKYLKEHGIKARDVAEIVGPPLLGHRVVTLSREIHASLLAKDTPEDNAELERIGVPRIDLVYVDFYPLAEEMERDGATFASVVERVDIGGPALLRSAAKGGRIVIVRPEDIEGAVDFIRREDEVPANERVRYLKIGAATAEMQVSRYCETAARAYTIAWPD